MLVLTRKTGEKVRIGKAVVTVAKIKGNTVRLAFEADESVPIVRGEIKDKPRPGQRPESEEAAA